VIGDVAMGCAALKSTSNMQGNADGGNGDRCCIHTVG